MILSPTGHRSRSKTFRPGSACAGSGSAAATISALPGEQASRTGGAAAVCAEDPCAQAKVPATPDAKATATNKIGRCIFFPFALRRQKMF